jgi:hypothetical protein
MLGIPRAPLLLGLAGLIPFVWGALTILVPSLGDWTVQTMGGRFAGPYIGNFYGVVILSFMSGVIWGFATRLDGAQAAAGYALSTLPALWAFFMTGSGAVSSSINLMVGFTAVLALDYMFWKNGVTPEWWLRLRILLTGVVLSCLAVGAFW